MRALRNESHSLELLMTNNITGLYTHQHISSLFVWNSCMFETPTMIFFTLKLVSFTLQLRVWLIVITIE